MTDIVEHEATPRAELERQIMDPNIPKNEREWWAAAEIERLRKIEVQFLALKEERVRWFADNEMLTQDNERLRAACQKAVDYHRLGYDSASDFDANTMIAIMDELGVILDESNRPV